MSEKRRDNKGRILRNGESQRKDGKYEFKYTNIDGVRHSIYSWKLVDTDKIPEGKRCKESLRAMEERLQKDVSDKIDHYKADNITLNKMFDIYISLKVNLKASTRETYIYMYKKYVRDKLGFLKISSIKYSDIKALYISLILEKGFKVTFVERIHIIIYSIFQLAVLDNYMRINPAAKIMGEIIKAYKSDDKRIALTKQQQIIFMDFVKTSRYKRWLNLLTFLLGTGCRIGEAAAIKWSDCDFENNVITVRHSISYYHVDGKHHDFYMSSPKTDAGKRIIPMFAEVKQALIAQKELRKNIHSKDFYELVFLNSKGKPYCHQSINKALRRICISYNNKETKLAQSENRDPVLLPIFSVHILRHTFCTRFCENETNLKVIQEIMGHKHISTTMDIYNNVTKQDKIEHFQGLEGKILIG